MEAAHARAEREGGRDERIIERWLSAGYHISVDERGANTRAGRPSAVDNGLWNSRISIYTAYIPAAAGSGQWAEDGDADMDGYMSGW